jgi:hypothetical protein
MGDYREKGLGNKPIIIISGFIASIITILTFLSGKPNIGLFFSKVTPEKPQIITVIIEQSTLEPNKNTQPKVIVVTQKPQNTIASDNNLTSFQTPTKIIHEYYSNISSGNYQKSWSFLSKHFKDTYNSSGYQPYADWWCKVRDVEVLSANVENQDSNSAQLSVELKYYYQNGQIDTYDLMSFTLVTDSSNDSWLINDAHLIKGTR